MSTLPLIIAPNSILKTISKEVEKIDSDLQKLMLDMVDTMYEERGVGLAAIQVGVPKRVLVMDVDYKLGECGTHSCSDAHIKGKKPIFMVNPKIINSSKTKSTFFEGCLSFPEIRAEIKRSEEVKVEYLDYNGKKQTMKADGLLSICAQHEIDHLNGITFVDYLSKIKREMLMKKMQKLLKSRL